MTVPAVIVTLWRTSQSLAPISIRCGERPNPATEAQAVDRIGPTRSVMVYRLVAKDTIEEKVMALKA